jgi:AcrR family transcriptional regulator
MSDATPRKPANRPSRRQDLIGAAVELLSLQPWDMVTVADIVDRAGMTPAAFYYHFSSREQLLEEVVEDFAEKWVVTIEASLEQARTIEDLCQIPVMLLSEIEDSQEVARIFFLSAASAPMLVERIHRDARNRLVCAAIDAVTRIAPKRTVAMSRVSGVALVLVCEMAVRAHLSLDDTYRVLGPRRFRDEIANLSVARPRSPRPDSRRCAGLGQLGTRSRT